MAKIIYALRVLLGAFFPSVRPQARGSVTDFVIAKTADGKATTLDAIKKWHQNHNYPFSEDYGMVLLQDYENPNTFNDILVVWAKGFEPRRVRVTGEAGNWTAAQKEDYNIQWCAAWVPGYYPDCFSLYKRGKRYERIKMPAAWNLKEVDLLNKETGKIQKGRNCDIHGRRSIRELVQVSSAGCIVTKNGKKVIKVIGVMEMAPHFKVNPKNALFGIAVERIEKFPDITGMPWL